MVWGRAALSTSGECYHCANQSANSHCLLGLGALLTLIILGLVLFIVIRRSNAVSLGLLLGLLGYAIASQGVPESLRNAVKAGAKTAASKAAAHGEAEPEPESTRYG